MAISLRAAGTATGATAAVTAVNPAVPTGTVAGDLSVLAVWVKPYNATITTPANWYKIGENTNGTTAGGTDTGSMKIALFVREGAPVGAIGAIGQSSANSMGAVIHSYQKASTEKWDYTTHTDGGDTSNGANFSATGAAGIDIASGDWAIAATAVCGDVGTVSAQQIGGMSGATMGTVANRTNAAVTTGLDSRGLYSDRECTAGSSTAAPTYTYTNASNTSGATMWLRLRVTTPPTTGTLLTETFTGTDGDAWPSGWDVGWGTGTIQSNAGRLDPGTGAYANARVDCTSAMASTGDVEMLVSLQGTAAGVEQYAYHFIDSDCGDSGNWEPTNCYFVSVEYNATPASSQILIGKSIAGTVTTLSTVGKTLTGTTKYWLRIRRVSTTLEVRLWADGAGEPGTWDYSTTVTDGISGRIGFLAANGAATTARLFAWDDLEVTDGNTGTPGDVAAVLATATAAAAIPAVTAEATVTAVLMQATAAAAAPTVVGAQTATTAATLATATAAAAAPVVTAAATVVAVRGQSTATAPAPAATAAATVQAVRAQATATAHAPAAGVSVSTAAPCATATALAPVPVVTGAATVQAVRMQATALAVAPAVTAADAATVLATLATATATAHAPTVASASNIAATCGTATAGAQAPTVGGGATVQAVRAQATTTAAAPVVTAAATVVAPVATATATAYAPAVTLGQGVAAPAATATATMLAPTVSVPVGVQSTTATATAQASIPVVSAAAVVAAVRATATALAQPPAVSAAGLVMAPAAAVTGTFRAPAVTAGATLVSVTATALAAMWAPQITAVDGSDVVLVGVPLSGRWSKAPLPAKYDVQEVADRFVATYVPNENEYTVQPLTDRFVGGLNRGEPMSVEVLVSAGAVKYVGGTVTETAGVDISAAVFEMSLGSATDPGTWVTPDVSQAGDTVASRVLKLKVSSSLPAGIVVPGTYWCWARITATPEIEPVRLQGPITVR